MIPVKRLGQPGILAQKKVEWQAKYDLRRAANPKERPASKQYAHPDVVATLESMSHRKCFYCEGEGKMTVDHYVEVAERGDLAFTWKNLYLACDGCQNKVPNKSIPVTNCVDPCDLATDPAGTVTFQIFDDRGRKITLIENYAVTSTSSSSSSSSANTCGA